MKKVEFMNLFDGKPLNILEAATRNYAGMKKALLQAYGKTVEGVRSQFQSAMLQDKETVSQFHARLASYLDQWIEKDETPKTVVGIRDLMLRTQLEQSCPPELVARMKTHKVKDMKTMVDMADAHFAAYGYNTRKQINKKFPNRHSPQQQESSSATPSIQSHQQLKQHQQSTQQQQSYERSKHQYRGDWKGNMWSQKQQSAAAIQQKDESGASTPGVTPNTTRSSQDQEHLLSVQHHW
ncbi:hypothetical protein E2C01_051072 [Portunus trituberculatus]|uniref:Uncharacterized protein n=1 Tax=Portunus trituberculatus TaxID=210409 RepID=A0A5B7GJ76_PORTR|nr:hypothetical protein [Portunus trituberculatus]